MRHHDARCQLMGLSLSGMLIAWPFQIDAKKELCIAQLQRWDRSNTIANDKSSDGLAFAHRTQNESASSARQEKRVSDVRSLRSSAGRSLKITDWRT